MTVDHDKNETQEKLHIFVNKKEFSAGVTPKMTVDAIAQLVGLTAATSVVREQIDGKPGSPLSGEVGVRDGEHFVVTRKNVEGGFDDVLLRIEGELRKLRNSGQKVTLVDSPRVVVYHDLPCIADNAPVRSTDVMVQVPGGYAAAPLDYAFLPAGSPLIGRVKGSPQGMLSVGNTNWQQISYHPHGNGGGPAWNPNSHGFHTYIDELLTWLASVR
jgi:hypothetical protein